MIHPRTRAAFFNELTKIADGELEALRQVEKKRADRSAKGLRTAAGVLPTVRTGALALGTVSPEVSVPIRRAAKVIDEGTRRAARSAEEVAKKLEEPAEKQSGVEPPKAPKLTLQKKLQTKARKPAKMPNPTTPDFDQQSVMARPPGLPPG